jgi:hypothetical protein
MECVTGNASFKNASFRKHLQRRPRFAADASANVPRGVDLRQDACRFILIEAE